MGKEPGGDEREVCKRGEIEIGKYQGPRQLMLVFMDYCRELLCILPQGPVVCILEQARMPSNYPTVKLIDTGEIKTKNGRGSNYGFNRLSSGKLRFYSSLLATTRATPV